ncbi:DUF1573 domain-containing protein [Pontiella sulfatireligans]|uniref:DUF1573 domain-containing protein n=1 Tax=Pontiella sulfatireligans TaxID=2750658 RepID=A0A6C2UR06_9BACT|nr:DUF1573 domain-containing protein [Pontiella sulfatireligans]VGO21697.1 hypothetical protein SCARR_03771 [Pontiella sulfatireligans]
MKWIIAIGLLAGSSAWAGLRWEASTQTLKVHPTQIEAMAVFRFSNAGDQLVTLSSVNVTCGCLAPRLDKRTYAPGESGELAVKFDLRNRTGKQHKATVVKTSDGATVSLFIDADIPKSYDIAPIMMTWAGDNPAATKTAKLTNSNKEPIKLLSVASSHKALPAELKTIREGFEYEVVVTRLPAAKNARSVVRITTEPPPGQTEAKTLKFYVHVK